MHVSSEDVENVVLQIFANLCIPPAGKLHHSTLTKHWRKYRFRQNDLSLALSGLIRSETLAAESTDDGLVLVLTHAGYMRAANRVRRGLARWKHALRISWLFLDRFREDTGSRVRRPNRRQGRTSDRDTEALRSRQQRPKQ